MRIRDWSSDVCSSDLQHLNLDVARLLDVLLDEHALVAEAGARLVAGRAQALAHLGLAARDTHALAAAAGGSLDHHRVADRLGDLHRGRLVVRSEEHTSELQSLMRISYAVFCLKKKNNT